MSGLVQSGRSVTLKAYNGEPLSDDAGSFRPRSEEIPPRLPYFCPRWYLFIEISYFCDNLWLATPCLGTFTAI